MRASLIMLAVLGAAVAGCEDQGIKAGTSGGTSTMGNTATSGSAETVRFATAWSTNADPAAAGAEATAAAVGALGCEPKGLIFFTYYEMPGFEGDATQVSPDPAAEKKVAEAVAKVAGGVPNIGGRARALTSGGTLLKNAVSVLAIGGRQADCKTAVADLPADDRKGPGEKIAAAVQDVKDLKIVVSLSNMDLSFGAAEGVSVEDYIRAVLGGTKPGVTLFGGNTMPSGDALSENKLKRSQYCNGTGYEHHVVAMGIGGPIEVFANHDNEFPPCEQTVPVTETKGKWVVTLDGKPAEEVYRTLRGMKGDEPLTSDWQHPVGVVIAPEKVYLRMILDWVDKDGKDRKGEKADAPPGSLRFVSPVAKGAKIKVLAGGSDARAVVESARKAMDEAVAAAEAKGEKPALALISDCCARGMRLRKFRTGSDDEVTEAIRPALGSGVPIFGFYAWGELGRIRGTYQGLDHQYQQHTFVTSVIAVKQ